jgi:hypothetical protein
LNRHAAREVRAILGKETLGEASAWADDTRSNPRKFWRRTASPWRYGAVPAGRSYADVGAPPEGDAVTALRQFAATLRDPRATREQKQPALRFSVHITGDLHLPLHAGNGTDEGGNQVRVTLFRQPANLHAVRDSGLTDRRQLSHAEVTAFLTRRITSELRRQWQAPDPLVWIAVSAAIRDTIYPEGEGEAGPARIGAE